jgi:hypothetical protein
MSMPPQSGSGMNKKVLWGIVIVVVAALAFMFFGRSASVPETTETPDTQDEAAAGTVPAGINEVVVSRSADLSAHAKIVAAGAIIEEFDVKLQSYSDITPVLKYIMDHYGADNPTLSYKAVLAMVTFQDVSRPAGE